MGAHRRGELAWHNVERRRKKVDVEVDWHSYFQSIRGVCPWSLSAYKREGIDIQPWGGEARPLGTWAARIYLAPRHKPRQLKRITDRLNRTQHTDEWLWSHPKYQHHSAPVACMIQQDRKTLYSIREKL